MRTRRGVSDAKPADRGPPGRHRRTVVGTGYDHHHPLGPPHGPARFADPGTAEGRGERGAPILQRGADGPVLRADPHPGGPWHRRRRRRARRAGHDRRPRVGVADGRERRPHLRARSRGQRRRDGRRRLHRRGRPGGDRGGDPVLPRPAALPAGRRRHRVLPAPAVPALVAQRDRRPVGQSDRLHRVAGRHLQPRGGGAAGLRPRCRPAPRRRCASAAGRPRDLPHGGRLVAAARGLRLSHACRAGAGREAEQPRPRRACLRPRQLGGALAAQGLRSRVVGVPVPPGLSRLLQPARRQPVRDPARLAALLLDGRGPQRAAGVGGDAGPVHPVPRRRPVAGEPRRDRRAVQRAHGVGPLRSPTSGSSSTCAATRGCRRRGGSTCASPAADGSTATHCRSSGVSRSAIPTRCRGTASAR